jgi:hypothetical protein
VYTLHSHAWCCSSSSSSSSESLQIGGIKHKQKPESHTVFPAQLFCTARAELAPAAHHSHAVVVAPLLH